MHTLKRVDLEKNMSDMIIATVGVLEDLHVVHCKTDIKKLLKTKIPFGDITVARLIYNIYKILIPVMDVARRNFPAFFAIFDWCESVVRKLFRK